MSLASGTGNTWKETRWICEQCFGLISRQDACRATIWSSIGSIQPVLENSGFEATLADCTQLCNHGILLGVRWVEGESRTSGDSHWSHKCCAGHNSTARAETSVSPCAWRQPAWAGEDQEEQGVTCSLPKTWETEWGGTAEAVCWWPWQVPMRGGRAGHTPCSVGVGKPSGAVGRQCWLPRMLSTMSWHAGPEPTVTACTTISPLFLMPTHPEAVAAFPTPTGRMWDFPGCEMQQ